MPQINSATYNNSNYESSSWLSDVIHLSLASSFNFSVYCDKNCDMVIQYIADLETLDVLYEKIQSISGNAFGFMTSQVKTAYVRFQVKNIVFNPYDLFTSAFYFIV